MALHVLASSSCLLLLCAQSATGPQKPAALLAMEQARNAIVSGRVEWSLLPNGDPEKRQAFVCRYAANGDTIFEERGDKDGWTVTTVSQGGVSKYPQISMRNAEGFWYYPETTLGCSWWKDKPAHQLWPKDFMRPVKDVRWVGTSLGKNSLDANTGFAAVWHNEYHKVVSWDQQQLGDRYLVTAHFDSGGVATWEIDPNKGWNVERATFELGSIHQELVCNLKQYGDVWLPETTDYRLNGETTTTVRIESASLNQPGDAKQFTLADMGMEAGMQISCQDSPEEPGKPPAWNGEEVCSWDTWIADLKSGKRQWGPKFTKLIRGEPVERPYETEEQQRRRLLARAKMGVRSALNRHQDLWSRYVADFIERHELNEDQAHKAQAILSDCQAKAEQKTMRLRMQCAPLLTELDAQGELKPDQQQRLDGLLGSVREAVDKIFTEQLKPRLERLPTRAQKEAAERHEATKTEGSTP